MNAILNLASNKVVTLDTDNEHLFPTEIGRICSYYYVSFRNFCRFISLIKDSVVGRVTHDTLLGCLCECSDFSKFIMRKSELEELSLLSGDSFEYLGFYSNDTTSDRRSNKVSASEAFSQKIYGSFVILSKANPTHKPSADSILRIQRILTVRPTRLTLFFKALSPSGGFVFRV